ncbi:hypothetical protein L1987_70811 [Smallanthus sonchifolius]|uniref:Uncharacterized protein n=1 Tax=Smallanthus sonchifolius TaxID=185202 RepID=A0ACB9ARJ8_9ASTR|nr:hypothetical protein L1987_70811 [Smallanthus sonchifolius]
MAEPEQTERVDSDIEDAAFRTEAQDQAHAINVFTNTYSKQQFTFDDIPPSKWRERSVEMLSWCSAELRYYNIDMAINVFTNTYSKQQLTFDDIPPSKWRERSVEMLSRCSAELRYYNIDRPLNGF